MIVVFVLISGFLSMKKRKSLINIVKSKLLFYLNVVGFIDLFRGDEMPRDPENEKFKLIFLVQNGRLA